MGVNEPKIIRGGFRNFRNEKGKYRPVPRRLRGKMIQRVKKGIEGLNLGYNRLLVEFRYYSREEGVMLRIILAQIDDSKPQTHFTFEIVPPLGLDDPVAKRIVKEVIEPACREVLGGNYSFELST